MERTKGMELQRTKGVGTNETQVLLQRVHELSVMSAMVDRARLSTRLGQQFGGDRDLYKALGYQTDIQITDYFTRYYRQDIAKAVIDRPVKASWQGTVLIQENAEVASTPLESGWKDLCKQLDLKTKFSRVDRLCGIGEFAVLLLGLNDVKTPSDYKKPVNAGSKNNKLIFVKPYGQTAVNIKTLESDPTNERYGLPLIYSIKLTDKLQNVDITTVTTTEVDVHYTRVVHIVDDVLESEIIGNPRLESIWNRMMDLEKIVGGDAEMYWRGARPGFQGKVDKDFQMTPETRADLKDQIDEYENYLRRILVNEGVSYEALQQKIANPANHVDIQIQMIATVTGIPKRILTGTERGELSSNQDAAEWRSYVQSRREDHAEPNIVRPFIDRCIKLQILPKPTTDDYVVIWSDLYALSESDKVKIGLDRSTALKNYLSAPMGEGIVPPEAFLIYFLGLKDQDIEAIKQMGGADILAEMQKMVDEAQQPAVPAIPPTQQPVGKQAIPKPTLPKDTKPAQVKK